MKTKKSSKTARGKRGGMAGLDLDPDAWPKFEALVKSAAKMGHTPHRLKPTNQQRKNAKRPKS
jgi:hypothetical protein